LTFWLETGFLGLVSLIWLLIIFYRRIWQLKNLLSSQESERFNSFLPIIFSGAMTTLIVHGFFDTPYFKNDLSVLFWLIYSAALTSADRLSENVSICHSEQAESIKAQRRVSCLHQV